MSYQQIDSKIISDKGEVAISYFTEIQHIVRIAKTDYVFVPKRHVCMAWIKPEHVDEILQLRKKCCGGRHSAPAYRLTSISNVRIWTGDAER